VRRVLRDRPLPGLLRQPARPPGRTDPRLGRLGRLRRAAGRDRAHDVPAARARAVRRALPRAGRPVAARAGDNPPDRLSGVTRAPARDIFGDMTALAATAQQKPRPRREKAAQTVDRALRTGIIFGGVAAVAWLVATAIAASAFFLLVILTVVALIYTVVA